MEEKRDLNKNINSTDEEKVIINETSPEITEKNLSNNQVPIKTTPKLPLTKKEINAKKKKRNEYLRNKRHKATENMNFFEKLFHNGIFIKILSVVIAIFLWLFVAINISPLTNKSISGVAINFDISDTASGALGLNVLDSNFKDVTVVVNGNRSKVANLMSSDFIVKPQLNSVNAPGTYEVKLEASKSNPETNSDLDIVSISPNSVLIRFDTVSKATIPVVIDQSNVIVSESLKGMNAIANVKEITVSGPTSDINNIKEAFVQIPKNQAPLSSTTNFTCPILLRDANKNLINENISKFITLSKNELSVTLPVYKTKRLPLSVNFLNLPDNYKNSDIDYTLDRRSIEIAGQEETINTLTEIKLGDIDLNELYLGYKKEFKLEIPSDCVNLENIEKINFEFNPENYTTKKISVRKFSTKNVPVDKNVTFLTKVIYNVELIGDKTVLNNLKVDDVYYEIDLIDKADISDLWNINGTIKTTTNSLIWTVKKYPVAIKLN